MIKGKITRPNYGDGDKAVVLTATIKKGSITKTITFDALVKQKGMTDIQKVSADKNALNVVTEKIKGNITLPEIGVNGSKITWKSSDTAIISNTGIVSRPVNGSSTDAGKVTLTATITNGSETDTKEFICNVLAWTDEEEAELDAEMITWDNIKGENISKSSVTTDLEFIKTGNRGSVITYSSNNEAIINTDGIVSRPKYTQGDTVITITAHVTKNTVKKDIVIPGIKVLKLGITNKEAADIALNAIDGTAIKGDNNSLNEVIKSFRVPKTSRQEDCSTVTFTWALHKKGTSEELISPNASLQDEGEDYILNVVRPTSSEKNFEATLVVTATSNAIEGAPGTATKSFDIIILKEAATSKK